MASVAPLLAAFKITGDGNGMRLQLDVPETEVANALALMLYRQCSLRVTIEPLPNTPQIVKQKAKSEEDLLDDILDDNPNL